MKALAGFGAGALLLLIAPRATAQCVSYHLDYERNTASSIAIVPGTGWQGASYNMPNIGTAISRWSTCASQGTSMPALTQSNGEITISVNYNAGTSPHPAAEWACTYFEPTFAPGTDRVTGGAVQFWERSANGTACNTTRSQSGWDGTLAHEIGHVLGLANSGCPNIMGSSFLTASASSEECAWVEDRWDLSAQERCENGTGTSQYMCAGFCDSGGFCTEPAPNTTGCWAPNDPACPPSWYNDPLVLDLDGDGIATTAATDGVSFDISGDGMPERVGWTVAGANDAFLYFDHNHNGVIDGVTELFGDANILPGGTRSANGFEALAADDRNFDGEITPADAVWGRIRLWVDRNHDGRMTKDENYSLAQQNIVGLSLSYETAPASEGYGVDAAGNQHRLRGTFTVRTGAGGISTRSMHDIFFRWPRR